MVYLNKTFTRACKLEPIKYDATLIEADASRGITGTSREKLYQETGLESLQRRDCATFEDIFISISRLFFENTFRC